MRQRSVRDIALNAEMREQLGQLARCKVMPHTWDQRFIRNLNKAPDGYLISRNQAEMINRLYHRYRRQVAALACHAKLNAASR